MGTSATRQRVVLLIAGLVVAAATVAGMTQSGEMITLPDSEGAWTIAVPQIGRTVSSSIRVSIEDLGNFVVDPDGIVTARPDIIQAQHFSVFDVIVRLGELGEIDLVTHYDESMAMHVIDSINGETGWWYEAHYSGGWFERNAHRMDHYLVKDETFIKLYEERESRLETLYAEFAEEVDRLAENDGVVIIPRVLIEGPRRRPGLDLADVVVTAHDTRLDLFQPGTITALDILLSLGEQGVLTRLGLTWYEWIFTADPVDHYFIEDIQSSDVLDAQAYDTCGFVYEVGTRSLGGFAGTHIHIPTDARVLVSPDYALWFWICL